MAAFSYQAVDSAGKQHSGLIEAGSLSAARRSLREKNLLPIVVNQTKDGSSVTPGGGDTARPGNQVERSSRPLPLRGLAIATRQLATLTGNDVRTEEALRIAAQQAVAPRVAASLWNVRSAVMEGQAFTSALNAQGECFPEYFRASVAAGERSGKLPVVLDHLARYVEAQQGTQNKVMLALLYPAILAVVSLMMVTLLLVFVVPDIVRVFVTRGVELPLLTQILIAVSGFVTQFGLYGAALLVGACLFGRTWLRKPANRLTAHRLVATAAGLRILSRQINSARFSGTLATLVQSGAPLLESMQAAAAATPNLYVRDQLKDAVLRVNDGASLSRALQETGCFAPMLMAMIASGENGGKLGPALERASADQERDIDALVAAIVALVEPGVLLLMGGFVLLLVLAILLPIVNLNNLAGV